jgi:GNAT superfamily N-acetyltransferase
MLMIDWFEGSRDALADLFALADDSAAAVSRYRDLGRVLVARDGSTIVGHLQLTAGERDDEAEVKSLAVRRDRQGRGVGRLLIERAAAICREEGRATLLVATAAADTAVLRFYQRSGFRMLRVERDAIHPCGRLSADEGRRHPAAGSRLALARTVMRVPWPGVPTISRTPTTSSRSGGRQRVLGLTAARGRRRVGQTGRRLSWPLHEWWRSME